ncbi:hypothetical protein VIBHAR_05342 [Vibrio campbellii ATCC BAA-1116]|uniref:Uncharacterized protein n=1 Tax=Vibrio campbellii (strain ATCC BAA-1116) TaxID=2902295 RepID=A7N7B0_VIBC1|nr:hypothetical protein VIBHAR_05342 [Vibrio campbellii ATCC BAA-1116]
MDHCRLFGLQNLFCLTRLKWSKRQIHYSLPRCKPKLCETKM